MATRTDLKPPLVRLYIELLDGRPGVVGVWIMHGAPCIYGHKDCVGYLGVTTPEALPEVTAEFARLYQSSKALRDSGMCWALTSTDVADLAQLPLNWERVVLATGDAEARAAGVSPHHANRCVNCGFLSNGSTSLGGKGIKPEPGHISLCAGCGFACRFNEDLRLVALTDAERAALPKDVQEALARETARIAAMRSSNWRRS